MNTDEEFEAWFSESKRMAEQIKHKSSQSSNFNEDKDEISQIANQAIDIMNEDEKVFDEQTEGLEDNSVINSFSDEDDYDNSNTVIGEDNDDNYTDENDDIDDDDDIVDDDDDDDDDNSPSSFIPQYSEESDDVYDAKAESYFYNNNSSASVMDDILGVSQKSDDEDDDEEFDDSKVSFESLMNSKNNFKPGKLNKNLILIIAAAIVLFCFILYGLTSASKKKKAEESAKAENVMNIDGYDASYGDYKSRAYQKGDIDDIKDDLAFAEQLITNDKEFVPEKTPSTPSSALGQYNATSSSSSNSEIYNLAVNSPIRTNGNGWGDKASVSYNEGSYPLQNTKGQNSIFPNTLNPNMSKDEYVNSYLESLSSVQNSLGSNNNNSNASKDSHRWSTHGAYNPNESGGDINLIPPNSIYPGTVLTAVLISGINTDYPGDITARIISPVYDSKTGKTLLIPQGSILRGSYSSSSIGVSRVQIAWQTLIINRDGIDYVVNLGSMNGVDPQGYSGIKGSLNDHAFQYVKAAGLSALFTMINHNIFVYSNAQKNKTVQDMIAESQDIGNKLADKLMQRALDIQPTVIVRKNVKINVDVNKILTLVPYERDEPVQKYIRK